METIVNEKAVIKLVQEIKEGKEEQWNQLYSELAKHKSFAVRKSARKLSGVCSKEDVNALYDDCLMEAVEAFNPVTNDSFTAFLIFNFNTRGINIFNKEQAEKRQANINAVNVEDEIIEYEKTTDDLINEIAVTDLMKQYSTLSEKHEEQIKLIIAAMNSNEDDRVESLLSVLPEGISANSASVKLHRAKQDFKVFLEKVKFL